LTLNWVPLNNLNSMPWKIIFKIHSIKTYETTGLNCAVQIFLKYYLDEDKKLWRLFTVLYYGIIGILLYSVCCHCCKSAEFNEYILSRKYYNSNWLWRYKHCS